MTNKTLIALAIIRGQYEAYYSTGPAPEHFYTEVIDADTFARLSVEHMPQKSKEVLMNGCLMYSYAQPEEARPEPEPPQKRVVAASYLDGVICDPDWLEQQDLDNTHESLLISHRGM